MPDGSEFRKLHSLQKQPSRASNKGAVIGVVRQGRFWGQEGGFLGCFLISLIGLEIVALQKRNLATMAVDMNEEDYIPHGSIYKYTSVEGAAATLENTSFKFNCPLDFNDPFDCNVSILEFSKTKAAIEEYKEVLSQSILPRNMKRQALRELDNPVLFRKMYKHIANEKIAKSKVTCFSKNYTNTLMWSHYADQHRGVCLEFNGSMEPSNILERGVAMILNVNYDRTDTINYNHEKERAIVDLFTRKSFDWRYEEEVRIIVVDDSKYHKFNRDFLTGVVFGCRTSEPDQEILRSIIGKQGYDVPIRRAIRGKFALKFEALK
jgi:hypothetical protein